MFTIYQVEYLLPEEQNNRIAFVRINDSVFEEDIINMNKSIRNTTIDQILSYLNEIKYSGKIKLIRFTPMKSM
jgi:hypothetical protein